MSSVNETRPGMTLVAPGSAVMAPTVPTRPALVRLAEFLDRDDAFGGAGQRVAPQRHRHRAGVTGHAGEVRRQPRGAGYCRHHADGKVLLLQHRPLLDMQFDIGMQLAAGPRRRADMLGVEPELHHGLAHGESVSIARVEHAFVKGAGDRPAAEQRGGKPDALLVGETDDLDRKGQPYAPPVQIGDAGNRGDHAERTVPFAGVAHGVVMRSQHQAGQPGTFALIAAADIADGVEMHGHSGILHPGQDEIGRDAMFGRKEDPRQMLAASRKSSRAD